jgi:signal transduction histidine kinase
VLYESLFQQLPLAAAVVDADLVVADANASFVALVGGSPDTVVGGSVDALLEPFGIVGVLLREAVVGGAIAAALVGGDDGRDVVVDVAPIAGASDARWLVTVSARRPPATLADIRQSLHALKHEMNTPLTGALGNITLVLRRGEIDEKSRQRIATAEQEIKKVSALAMSLPDLVDPKGS